MRSILIIILFLTVAGPAVASDGAEQTVRLSTINWKPYTGEDLPNHGFFSELVTEAFSRVGYQVEFQYRPWARALMEAERGQVHGVMVVYWSKNRAEFLDYPDVVWKVSEEFIALKENPVAYDGSLASLKGQIIGVLNKSLQAREIQTAGIDTVAVNDQRQNVKMLLSKRIDAMLIPRDIFFNHIRRIAPHLKHYDIKILKPAYRTYDMYVAFSKSRTDSTHLTSQFNRGLNLIKSDGTFKKILLDHKVLIEETGF